MTFFWASTLLLALFWGGSYIAIRFVVEGAAPFSGAFTRILICGLLCWGLTLLRRTSPVSFKLKASAALTGVFMMGIPWALLFWAEQGLLPSLAALMVSSMPLFTQLFGPLVTPQDPYPAKLWFGIGVGFLGVFLLVLPGLQSPNPGDLWGSLALLGVSLSYSLGTLGVRRLSPHLSLSKNLFYQSIGSALFLLPFVLHEGSFLLGSWSYKVWGSLLYLGVCSTFIAWLLYFAIIRRYGATLASMIPYFPPVVSLFLDQIILGKIPELVSVIGGAVILVGVYLTQRLKKT